MSKKKSILITNDDGITAKGIASLVEAAKGLGDLMIVAPDKPQSGMGHAITVNNPLRFSESKYFDGLNKVESFLRSHNRWKKRARENAPCAYIVCFNANILPNCYGLYGLPPTSNIKYISQCHSRCSDECIRPLGSIFPVSSDFG